jgi:spermidine synthase
VFVPSTTFAFTTMLGTFLTGIAVGSSISSRYADRLRSPALALGLVEAGIALAALASLTSFAHLGSIADAVSGQSVRWTSTLAVEFLLPVVIMIVPTLLMGAAFPIVARIRVTDAATTGRGVGSIYAANTVGSIVGAFASGFVLIPLIGIQASVILAACGNLAVALIAFSRSSVEVRRRLTSAGTAVGAAVVLVLIAPLGRPVALSPGIEGFMGGQQEVVFYDEGISACVTVTENPELDVTSFFIDRWPVVGTSYDAMKTVKLLGHLPIVAAREARDVMIVGYGMGMTTWTVAIHDEVESIDVVELSEAVIEASGFFTDVNHNVLDDPRVSVHVDDGRNHLLMARGKYDVISCDPIHPAIGSGALYTRDFFQLARDHLNPGGAFVQYLPFHKMSHFDFRMLIRTFQSVFPNATVWDGAGHGVLLGTVEPTSFDLARRDERLDANPTLRADLAKCELADSADLMSCLMLDSASAADLAGDGPINTDNFPLIEFSEPRSVGRNTRYENLVALTRYSPSPERLIGKLPESDAEFLSRLTHVTTVRRTLASAIRELSRGNVAVAAEIVEDAWALEPEDADVRTLLERAAMPFWLDRSNEHLTSGRFEQALALCERILALDPAHSGALTGCGIVYGSQGRFEEAVPFFERAVASAPDDGRIAAGLAQVYGDAGHIDHAARAYAKLGTLENVDPVHVQRGLDFLLTRGLYREATSLAELHVEMRPKDVDGLGILGQCYAASGRLDGAIRVWEEALALRPSDTRLRQVLADAYRRARRTAPRS